MRQVKSGVFPRKCLPLKWERRKICLHSGKLKRDCRQGLITTESNSGSLAQVRGRTKLPDSPVSLSWEERIRIHSIFTDIKLPP